LRASAGSVSLAPTVDRSLPMRPLILAALFTCATPAFSDQEVVPQVVIEETAGEVTRPRVIPGILLILMTLLIAGSST
jgi:hypothetical protein